MTQGTYLIELRKIKNTNNNMDEYEVLKWGHSIRRKEVTKYIR